MHLSLLYEAPHQVPSVYFKYMDDEGERWCLSPDRVIELLGLAGQEVGYGLSDEDEFGGPTVWVELTIEPEGRPMSLAWFSMAGSVMVGHAVNSGWAKEAEGLLMPLDGTAVSVEGLRGLLNSLLHVGYKGLKRYRETMAKVAAT